jgi:hypothetical protein
MWQAGDKMNAVLHVQAVLAGHQIIPSSLVKWAILATEGAGTRRPVRAAQHRLSGPVAAA